MLRLVRTADGAFLPKTTMCASAGLDLRAKTAKSVSFDNVYMTGTIPDAHATGKMRVTVGCIGIFLME